MVNLCPIQFLTFLRFYRFHAVMCSKLCGSSSNTVSPSDDEDEESRTSDGAPGATLVKIAIFQVNPVTKTGRFPYKNLRCIIAFKFC